MRFCNVPENLVLLRFPLELLELAPGFSRISRTAIGINFEISRSRFFQSTRVVFFVFLNLGAYVGLTTPDHDDKAMHVIWTVLALKIS